METIISSVVTGAATILVAYWAYQAKANKILDNTQASLTGLDKRQNEHGNLSKEHGSLSKEHGDILNQTNNIQTSIANIHMSVSQIKEITISEHSKAEMRYQSLSESDKKLHDFVDNGVNSIKDLLYKYQIAVATIDELRFENRHLKTELKTTKSQLDREIAKRQRNQYYQNDVENEGEEEYEL